MRVFVTRVNTRGILLSKTNKYHIRYRYYTLTGIYITNTFDGRTRAPLESLYVTMEIIE